MDTAQFLYLMMPPKVDEIKAYQMGYDCGTNGASEDNCHFSIFSKPESTKAWEAGKKDAEEGLQSKHPVEQ